MHVIVAENDVSPDDSFAHTIQADALQLAAVPVQCGEIEEIAIRLGKPGRAIFHVSQHGVAEAFVCLAEQLQLPDVEIEGIEARIFVGSSALLLRFFPRLHFWPRLAVRYAWR